MNILEWVKNLPTWLKNLIGLVTTLVAFILLIKTNFHLGVSVTVIVLWVILVWNLVSILLSKNKVERHGLVPQPSKASYKYPRMRPWAMAGLFIVIILMMAIIGYPPTRNFPKYALFGTPTLSPTATALPTVTATPRPPDVTMLANTTGEGFCSLNENLYLREKSVIDIAINNNSDRIIMLTSVALLPQHIDGEPFLAGGLEPTEKYSVSLADWLIWIAYSDNGDKPPTRKLEPVNVPDIPADKYSIQPHTAERFQIAAGVDPDKFETDYLLYGSIIVEILLDNGNTLDSVPLDIMVCGSPKSEQWFSDTEAMFFEGVFALYYKGDIETAITKMQEAASYDLSGVGETGNEFADLCDQGTQRGYAEEVLFACDRAVQIEPNNTVYRETRGVARTIAGDFARAIEDFESSVSIDKANGMGEELLQQRQKWIAELKSGQNPFPGEAMLIKGVRALYADNLTDAIMYFHKALEIGFELPEDVSYWERLCESGSLNHMADEVLFACDHAIELATDDGEVRDSRGIARALAGDYMGAIEDFELAISDWERGSRYYGDQISLRQVWISELREGKSPTTEQFLAGLQSR